MADTQATGGDPWGISPEEPTEPTPGGPPSGTERADSLSTLQELNGRQAAPAAAPPPAPPTPPPALEEESEEDEQEQQQEALEPEESAVGEKETAETRSEDRPPEPEAEVPPGAPEAAPEPAPAEAEVEPESPAPESPPEPAATEGEQEPTAAEAESAPTVESELQAAMAALDDPEATPPPAGDTRRGRFSPMFAAAESIFGGRAPSPAESEGEAKGDEDLPPEPPSWVIGEEGEEEAPAEPDATDEPLEAIFADLSDGEAEDQVETAEPEVDLDLQAGTAPVVYEELSHLDTEEERPPPPDDSSPPEPWWQAASTGGFDLGETVASLDEETAGAAEVGTSEADLAAGLEEADEAAGWSLDDEHLEAEESGDEATEMDGFDAAIASLAEGPESVPVEPEVPVPAATPPAAESPASDEARLQEATPSPEEAAEPDHAPGADETPALEAAAGLEEAPIHDVASVPTEPTPPEAPAAEEAADVGETLARTEAPGSAEDVWPFHERDEAEMGEPAGTGTPVVAEEEFGPPHEPEPADTGQPLLASDRPVSPWTDESAVEPAPEPEPIPTPAVRIEGGGAEWGARWRESAQGWVEETDGRSTWRPIVTTSPILSEWEVDTYLGIVTGDIGFTPEEGIVLEQRVAAARATATRRMVDDALARGAHAVIAVNTRLTQLGGQVVMSASGTAVTLKARD